MKSPIEQIKDEHQEIERELLELDTIIESALSPEKDVNYSNLVHELKKLISLWNLHERKESEVIFPALEKRNKFKIPVEKMTFQHSELREHRDKLVKALSQGEEKTLEALREDVPEIIRKLRQHIENEDSILYTLADDETFSEEETEEINSELKNID